MSSPLEATGDERLEALRSYCVLDTPAEKVYDDLVYLASMICDMPVSLVTLLDSDRQWFKAKLGFGPTETPLDASFCRHSVASKQTLVVSDALADERFVNNPLVTGSPGIRFYAGAPLITPEGHALGSICVLDMKPREISGAQIRALEALGSQVTLALELRRSAIALRTELEERKRTSKLLREAVAMLKGALEAARDAVLLVKSHCGASQEIQLEIAELNARANSLFGKPRWELLNCPLASVGSAGPTLVKLAEEAIAGGKTVLGETFVSVSDPGNLARVSAAAFGDTVVISLRPSKTKGPASSS